MPGIFDDQFKSFFLKHNDPVCVKVLKLDVLSRISNATNASEILNEISEYVADANTGVARKSIRTIGALAIKVEEVGAELLLSHHFLLTLDAGC